ncbi:MAG: condensation domain-containing protein, partial [Polyangiaceae bacterium]
HDPAAEATKFAESARTPFAFAGAIPTKVLVARVSDDRAHVVLLTHHIVADVPSLGIFARSFAAAYERALTGGDCSLEPPPVSYADFAQWEREWFTGEGIRRLESVRRRLADVPPVAFPSERPRGPTLSFEAHERSLTLRQRDLEAIMGVAKAESVTPYMLFLVAVGALVRGYTGATRVPVAGPTDTRHRRPELAQLAGRFLNVFASVVDVDGNPTVHELLARVRPAALDALEQRDVPTWYALGSENSFDCELHRLMLNGPTFWPKSQPILSRDGLTIAYAPLHVLDGERARNEVILSAWASDDELTLAARRASSLFDAEGTQRVVDSFGRILCASKPETHLSELLALCE